MTPYFTAELSDSYTSYKDIAKDVRLLIQLLSVMMMVMVGIPTIFQRSLEWVSERLAERHPLNLGSQGYGTSIAYAMPMDASRILL